MSPETPPSPHSDVTAGRQTPLALPVEPLALPAADAARLIGVSISHFYALHRTGRLPPPVRMGPCTRCLRQELASWMQAGCPARAKWPMMRKAT